MFDFLGIYKIIKPNNDYLNLERLEIWLTFSVPPFPMEFFVFLPRLCPTASNLKLMQIP